MCLGLLRSFIDEEPLFGISDLVQNSAHDLFDFIFSGTLSSYCSLGLIYMQTGFQKLYQGKQVNSTTDHI